MINADDMRVLVQNNSVEREAMFQYHRDHDTTLRRMTEYNARKRFEEMMRDPAKESGLINTYVPIYNNGQANAQQAQAGQQGGSGALKSAVGRGLGVAAGGLVALVLSGTVDNQQAKSLLQIAGAVAMVGGPVGIGIAYIRSRV